jgi:predicted metal-dependent phosphoesterase TrpH
MLALRGNKIDSYKLKANLHIHSYHSDGIMAPSFIVGYAKLAGVQVLSITDHNEIKGTLAGAKIADKLGLIFFPGIELTFTIKGKPYELLAYFLTSEEIKKFYAAYRFNNGFLPSFKEIGEVISLIHKFQGTEIVPHPFGRKGIFRRLRHRGLEVHAIEVINAFTGDRRNQKAKRHQAGENHFLKLAAADMHFFIGDIHKVYTELNSQSAITKMAIWNNLNGNSHDISFKPVGHQFSQAKIWFQKPLCGVVYFINYPRLYLSYRIGKLMLLKKR